MKNLLRAAGVAVMLAVSPAHAVGIPVMDVIQIGQMAETIRHNVAMVNTLIETMTIQNAMRAALGVGPGAEWATALDSISGLYSEGNRLTYNASTKMTSLSWEMDQLSPAQLQTMSIPELVQFGRRWQTALQTDSLAARALQAEGIAQQGKINTLRAQALISSQQAQGATSAIQAQTNLMGAVAGQLETTGITLSSMANMQNNSLMTEAKKNEIVAAWAARNREIAAERRAAVIKKAACSPLRWGTRC